ncbi:hypothetical protein Tco_0516263 [Tanacetum coccineum]
MESDELIKSSVENLVPIPSESEDFSDIESECDVPVCDNFTTFSNPLFDADDDFSSSDDESFSDEDVPKEIYSNPLFDEEIISTKIDPHHFNAESDLIESLLNQDTSIISSPKIDSLLEEFSGELAHIDLNVAIISEELADYINTPNWNRPAFYEDDDEEYTIAITPVLPTEEPDNSLSMGDEHLSTIPETESDEFIKSSVENLVQNPRESEDECECNVPDCDDSQTTNFSTFSNPLFDDSTSSDDESSHEEVIHKMSFKTYSNPLFDLDEEIISSEFNPIHNEDLDSTPKNDRFDTESYLLESLLNRDTLMASSPKIDPLTRLRSPDSTIDVVEDIPVDMPNIFPTHPTLHMDFDFIPSHNDLGYDLDVSSSSEDRNKIYDPRICIEVESTRFLTTLSPMIDTLLPFSFENEDKVFNHDVLASKEKSPPSSSHQGFKASKIFHHKSPMLIYGEDIPILDVPIAPDYEASRARGFVLRSLELQSLA